MMTMQEIKRFWLYSVVVLFLSIFFPVTTMAASNSLNSAISDSVITAKIKLALARNTLTHTQEIHVQTDNGVVFLKGKVEAVTEATTAIEIAVATKGVKKVDVTQLFVYDSSQPMTDTFITAKIKGIFLKNNLTEGALNVPLIGITVETQNGVVYLSGSVNNAEQRKQLIELAKSVEGVTDVKAILEIKKDK